MDMSPQQQQQQPQVEGEDEMFSRSRSGSQQEQRSKMKFQSCRRQSAPSLVITKALTRSKTLSRETFQMTVCAETCPFIQSYLDNSVRSFLLHAHAQLKTGMQTQDRHLFLFSDIMIVAKAKSANHFKLKVKVCVCEMWTASCVEEVWEGSTALKRSFVIGWPTYNCVATFSSSEQKEEWLSLLKSRIKEQKEAEEPKTIPLRVYGKGLNSFAVTKTLPVSNSDSTNEVIRLALQQFSIIGNVKDYQLWVISKRDASYPLIGHEFPFSIQMSHVRHSMSQGGGAAAGSASPASPVDREKILQKELLQVNRQCQFVLKPRPAEEQQLLLQEPSDVSQKTFRRRRSLVSWAFWRGSSSYLSELSLTGAAQGCLFGRPLSSVCVEDALPKPIMDMLTFLYHEGSWTRGIFRRPAGARAVRELRDSLDAGEFQLPLIRDHVFLIAGVFKDFLRSIPGSLLCCELHEEWMDVLEDDEVEEGQVQDIQRLMHRLPKENALLLRYLLAVLHTIKANAHENQMNAFNLSVCIAPSMLWPPGAPCSPEVEGKETKKVCELVRFMMEHCQQILGEEPTTLFGGPPQRCQSDETTTDSWLYPMTDSSYDSLENELDDSSGGSPALGVGHLQSKPLRGSQDSILTISDCDQEASPDIGRGSSVKLCSLVRTGGRRQVSDLGTSQEVLSMITPSSDDSLSMEGQHRHRRMSEPNIAYVGRFGPCTSGSADVLNLNQTLSPTNSLNSDHATVEFQPPKMSNETYSVTATTAKSSPPGEGLSWGTLKSCRGLHPNSWLRKDRKLSITQEDSTVKPEEKEKMSTGTTSQKHCELLDKAQHAVYTQGRTIDVSLKGRGVKQRICRAKKVCGGPTLSLFRRHKSHSVEKEETRQDTRLCLRRQSEPGWHVMEQPSPTDPGLKVTQIDSERAAFCLSPSATKSVKELFSSHPGSSLHSSQQMALTLVESHRQWLRRCSEHSGGDPDCEQPLFGEESFV